MRSRAVFLDRDGTINRKAGKLGVLKDVRELRVFPGAVKAIKQLNKSGFLVVVITNQVVIARGWRTEKELDQIHAVLIKRLAKKGAKIDAIYYCPHHPEATLKRYRLRCSCRKPNIGMITKAAKKFGINLRRSFLVGDTTRDILAGRRAGLTTILVKTGEGGKDGKYKAKPRFIAKDLLEAARIIKKNVK